MHNSVAQQIRKKDKRTLTTILLMQKKKFHIIVPDRNWNHHSKKITKLVMKFGINIKTFWKNCYTFKVVPHWCSTHVKMKCLNLIGRFQPSNVNDVILTSGFIPAQGGWVQLVEKLHHKGEQYRLSV